jgi:bacterial/archaeal transporter family protein
LTPLTAKESEMTIESWQLWALLSAVFAALMAIFAKIGVENIGSDLATFIRTVVVLLSFLVLLLATGQFATSGPISPRTWTFLILSGLGTGASWLCYFRALKLGPRFDGCTDRQIERRACRVFCLRIPGRASSATGWMGIGLIAAGAVIIANKA